MARGGEREQGKEGGSGESGRGWGEEEKKKLWGLSRRWVKAGTNEGRRGLFLCSL